MRSRAGLVAVTLVLLSVPLSACGRDMVAYVDRGATYSKEQLQTLLGDTGADAIRSRKREEAADLRHEALVQLRKQGDAASEAADVITRVFPATTESVPVYVERATVDGAGVLVVVEAWGKPGGLLSARRLWVLDANTGEVRYSAAVDSGG